MKYDLIVEFDSSFRLISRATIYKYRVTSSNGISFLNKVCNRRVVSLVQIKYCIGSVGLVENNRRRLEPRGSIVVYRLL